MDNQIEIIERTNEDLQPLKRQKPSPEELSHENEIRLLIDKFPNMDPLMASVLLKCPKERLAELIKQPEMWVVPEAEPEKCIIGSVILDDPTAIERQDF